MDVVMCKKQKAHNLSRKITCYVNICCKFGTLLWDVNCGAPRRLLFATLVRTFSNNSISYTLIFRIIFCNTYNLTEIFMIK